jgi:hypothetical protein
MMFFVTSLFICWPLFFGGVLAFFGLFIRQTAQHCARCGIWLAHLALGRFAARASCVAAFRGRTWSSLMQETVERIFGRSISLLLVMWSKTFTWFHNAPSFPASMPPHSQLQSISKAGEQCW